MAAPDSYIPLNYSNTCGGDFQWEDLHINEHFESSDRGVENIKPDDKRGVVHEQRRGHDEGPKRSAEASFAQGLMFLSAPRIDVQSARGQTISGEC